MEYIKNCMKCNGTDLRISSNGANSYLWDCMSCGSHGGGSGAQSLAIPLHGGSGGVFSAVPLHTGPLPAPTVWGPSSAVPSHLQSDSEDKGAKAGAWMIGAPIAMLLLLGLMMFMLMGCSTTVDPVMSVSNSVNKSMSYQSDIERLGANDRWDTTCPSKGDCEDYALCKARKLLADGVASERMALIVVHDKQKNIAHAVLQVDGKLYDNLRGVDGKTLAQVSNYRPIYGCYLNGYHSVYSDAGKEFRASGLDILPRCEMAFAELKGQ